LRQWITADGGGGRSALAAEQPKPPLAVGHQPQQVVTGPGDLGMVGVGAQLVQEDGYFLQVPGMFHLNPTDLPLLSPLASRLGLSGPIGAQRGHRIVNAYSLAFFDQHLKGQPAALLDGPAKQYPDVRFETYRPLSAHRGGLNAP
jgi:hypothetical protein